MVRDGPLGEMKLPVGKGCRRSSITGGAGRSTEVGQHLVDEQVEIVGLGEAREDEREVVEA